jgi:hypothetical protein
MATIRTPAEPGQAVALHHLPTHGQNAFYLAFLIFSPILNLSLNSFLFEDIRRSTADGAHSLPSPNGLFQLSGILR